MNINSEHQYSHILMFSADAQAPARFAEKQPASLVLEVLIGLDSCGIHVYTNTNCFAVTSALRPSLVKLPDLDATT